jgi:CheY-like chemotaxis protein
MPGMNGYELVERAKQARDDLKVIVLSGRETDGRGFPIVRKPFRRHDLLQTMKHNTGLC